MSEPANCSSCVGSFGSISSVGVEVTGLGGSLRKRERAAVEGAILLAVRHMEGMKIKLEMKPNRELGCLDHTPG